MTQQSNCTLRICIAALEDYLKSDSELSALADAEDVRMKILNLSKETEAYLDATAESNIATMIRGPLTALEFKRNVLHMLRNVLSHIIWFDCEDIHVFDFYQPCRAQQVFGRRMINMRIAYDEGPEGFEKKLEELIEAFMDFREKGWR